MRQDIQNKLGIKAYDIYGLTEISGPGVSFECSEQTGMHINEDHFIAEIIDPNTGEVLPDGEKGELVFTSITKEAFPLLRYRTRDICVLTREKCSCGRTHVKMSKPMGRSDDMLIVKGVNVFPSQIETVLLNKGYPANYQIMVSRENNSDKLEVQVEMTPEMFSDTVSARSPPGEGAGGGAEGHAGHLRRGAAGGAQDHRPQRGQGGAHNRQAQAILIRRKGVHDDGANRFPYFVENKPGQLAEFTNAAARKPDRHARAVHRGNAGILASCG